ncbi:uncharacterized protein At3g27210-like isoform X1 [Zingiber officinale]|uniref:Uncharacterized protein n=1 Tax=Zingiber officinale TaxID=94328 RepID=A0A8J5G3M8_ZINOF|nr:uncharacterized protein At3g27210-like isoform X1 [Zingiber officinale]KAG6497444.1 hypothetical protein ZIOFF_045344 [Zingiber officinale]
MGACTSIPNDSDSSMRYRLGLASKAKRFFLASPAKDKSLYEANPVDGFSLKSPKLAGSKDEIFFDTQVWLDSDCEDDFFSVNGDFTPSRGSTPIHPLSMPSTPKLDNHFLFDKSPYSISEPSPTGRKKLAELLYETNVTEVKEDATAKSDRDKTSTTRTSNSLSTSSACSTEGTPSRDLGSRKDKAWSAGHCCLPSLRNFGLDERRQKMSSPSPWAA